MGLISAMAIAGFIFWAAFMAEDPDDDEGGPGGGMLTPSYIPAK